jgi:hypothetical protein
MKAAQNGTVISMFANMVPTFTFVDEIVYLLIETHHDVAGRYQATLGIVA